MKRVLFAVVVLALAANGAEAQVGRGGDPRSQLQLEAATLESRGDLVGAEDAYRRLLALEPDASGTIFALERVLRAKGDLAGLRALVRDFVGRSDSSDVMALNLRLLIEADSLEAMQATAEGWLARRTSAQAYRAVAAAYERAFGAPRALEVLRRGRAILGPTDPLAFDIGDLLVESGDLNAGVSEWARAVDDGTRIPDLVERIAALGDRADDAARRLVRTLADSDVPQRRDAALSVALELGLEEESLDLVEAAADDLEGRSRVNYLELVATRAREAQMPGVAAWVYQALGGDTSGPEQRREVDLRIVEAALEAGDTAMALEAQRRVVASYSGSSEEGRRAQAEVIRLEASADREGVGESWRRFRETYPDAPELDDVGAAVAVSLMARGDPEGASAALEGIEGPRSTLERAYLLLAGGDIEAGRDALMAAVSGLPATDATSVIQFGSLLGRLSPAGSQALVAAGVAEHRGDGRAASTRLAEQAPSLPASDRAALLAEAARIAERSGAPDTAAEIRERLVADHPEAPEVAEASLALARHVVARGGDTAMAIRLLEDLITRNPNAAIVPEARLELERLRSSGGSRGS